MSAVERSTTTHGEHTRPAGAWVVTVAFAIQSGFAESFLERLATQAADSLREPGCLQFDVCVDPADPHRVFLYEVYESREAFDAHLASAHFTEFDAATRQWVSSKHVGQWRLKRHG